MFSPHVLKSSRWIQRHLTAVRSNQLKATTEANNDQTNGYLRSCLD